MYSRSELPSVKRLLSLLYTAQQRVACLLEVIASSKAGDGGCAEMCNVRCNLLSVVRAVSPLLNEASQPFLPLIADTTLF